MAPNSVLAPVSTTTAVAVPLTTCVPRYTAFMRCASGASGALVPACFSAGYDSPVSAAWSTKRSFASSSRASPGMFAPAARWTMSPGTTCSRGMSRVRPERVTMEVVWIIASSRWTAVDARCSCQKPRSALAPKIPRMMPPSARSPSASDSVAATSNRIAIGLLNCAPSSRSATRSARGAATLGPWRASRRAASSSLMPVGEDESRASSESVGTLQNAPAPVALIPTAGPPGPCPRVRGGTPRAG